MYIHRLNEQPPPTSRRLPNPMHLLLLFFVMSLSLQGCLVLNRNALQSTPTPGGAIFLPITSSGGNPTAGPLFDIRISLQPSAERVSVGREIVVTVDVENHSQGCEYPVYDLSLNQVGGATLFEYLSPQKIDSPVDLPAEFRLRAVSQGSIDLQALVYGERNCGDGWVWTYTSSPQTPIEVTP